MFAPFWSLPRGSLHVYNEDIMLEQLSSDTGIYLLSLILLLALFLSRLSNRVGIPGLVLFIGLGMVLGSDITGWVYFDNAQVARFIGAVALIVILFEGGLQTEWASVKPALLPAGTLASLGVIGTAAILGYAAHLILDIPVIEGMLLGSIVGSTDAAAVFATLGPRRISERVKRTVEAESAMNDPMAIFLTVLLLSVMSPESPSVGSFFGLLIWQAVTGICLGLGVGIGAVKVIRHLRFGEAVLYPAFFLSVSLITFSIASLISSSGYLAVYILGIVIGNAPIPLRHSVLRFHESVSWFAHVAVFTMLGLLVFPSQLIPLIGIGILITLVLMFVARPLAVWIFTLGMRFSWREKVFISWAGLRGVVPVVLATYPFLAGYDKSDLVFNAVFFVVITSALVQGSTISPLARWLGLELGPRPEPAHTLELLTVGEAGTELVEFRIDGDTEASEKILRDLELPENVVVCAISRGDKVIAPRGTTRLQEGDFLFVLTPNDLVPDVKDIFTGLKEEPRIEKIKLETRVEMDT